MKALHITFRFGKDIIGGAEYYLYMLSKSLVEKGIEVDVVTTKTKRLEPISRFGVKWDNQAEKDYEIIDGIKVHRFHTYNLPDYFTFKFNYTLQKRWDIEDDMLNEQAVKELIGTFIGTGWHFVENYDLFKMRWTKKSASFVIFDKKITRINFAAYCPERISGNFLVNGMDIGRFSTSEEWREISFGLDKDYEGKLYCEILLDNTWRPEKDPRRLGIAVRDIRYISGNKEKRLDIDNHYYSYFLNREEIVARLIERGKRRPKMYSYLFGVLRGPISPGMWSFLNWKVKDYDIILGHMTPFSTLDYAVYFGKKYKKPVVLLPHFHVDDDFYHWEHYYKALREADLVIAMSEYSKKMVFDRIGAKSVCIGAGITSSDYESPGISGNRFRDKFDLGIIPIILFVGRKSFPKRYDILIKAIDTVNKSRLCKLVIIGPDEDNKPITSKNVLYLGEVDKNTLIDAYDACDLFAMMSESESFGIVFLEAWMRKKPVIGNKNCGPISSLIEEGKDGFLCSSEMQLSEIILQLLNDKDRSIRSGEYGYKKVIEKFTWDAIGDKVSKRYEDLYGQYKKDIQETS